MIVGFIRVSIVRYTDVIEVKVKKEELHLETVVKFFVLHTRQVFGFELFYLFRFLFCLFDSS